MFARLDSVISAMKAIRYHELKIVQGKAELLLAYNYLKDAEQLTLSEKLFFVERHNHLNERIVRSTFHASLSFHPSEKMSNDRMKSISREYMKRIGFEEQPYLVYRHRDTVHPHVHIVSAYVKSDGDTIGIGSFFYHSRHIIRDMERQFNLIPSEKIILPDSEDITTIVYGQSEMKRSMNNILNTVIEKYNYISLGEFNAILRLYNVRADQAPNTAPSCKNNMLLYRVLDREGNHTGVPLRSRDFSFNPTVENLEKKMTYNASCREESRKRITTMVDWSLMDRQPGIKRFIREMEREGISVVLQKDKKGENQGIYYVDHVKKTAFDGNNLGDKYMVHAIQDRCGPELTPELKQAQKQKQSLSQNLRLRPWD